jgi:hypothetical protein
MNDADRPKAEEPAREPEPRKPYVEPRLEVYGDLADISKSVAGTSSSDGAGHPNRHFTR